MGAPPKNQTLGETVSKWFNELNEDEAEFKRLGMKTREWDRALLAQSEEILKLNEELQEAKKFREEIDQNLDFVKAQQEELSGLLNSLEADVEAQFKKITRYPADEDRVHFYTLAEVVNKRLDDMGDSLDGLVKQFNETNSEENPIVQLSQILNAHFNSLQYLDQSASQIQNKIQDLMLQADRAQVEQERLHRSDRKGVVKN